MNMFGGFFDDAAMFPPAMTPLDFALRAHQEHRAAEYGGLVGTFVVNAARVAALDSAASRHAVEALDVSVVVPGGIDAVMTAVSAVDATQHLKARSLEVPLGDASIHDAVNRLRGLRAGGRQIYVEIPAAVVDEKHAEALANAGLRLKLRTGGTTADNFPTERDMARALVVAAGERLAFKCTAGLHHAVRRYDYNTGFDHHGFLNIFAASAVAASTGIETATAAALADRDARSVAATVSRTHAGEARTLFTSVGTCSISEPVADLQELGLL